MSNIQRKYVIIKKGNKKYENAKTLEAVHTHTHNAFSKNYLIRVSSVINHTKNRII